LLKLNRLSGIVLGKSIEIFKEQKEGLLMRKSLSILILIVLISALLIVVSSKVYAMEKLIPLQVGQTFTYDVKDGVGNTWERVLAVTGKTNIPSLGKTYFHADRMDMDEEGPLDDPVMFNIRSTLKQVLKLKE
jgi:hypothetical protein